MTNLIKICFIILLFTKNIYGVYEKGGVLVPGAHGSGLGGAFGAKADDLETIFYNPAGLYQIKCLQIKGLYGGIFNIKRNIIGGVLSFNLNFLTTAFSYSMLKNYDNNLREDTYILSLSFPLFSDGLKEFGIGINAKYLYAAYESYASTLSADIGFLYKIKNIFSSDSINFGMAIQDLQSSIRWQNSKEEKIPIMIKTAVAYIAKDLFDLTLDMDIINDKNYLNNYKTIFRFGIEKNVNFISLRLGYAGFESVLSGITLGIGIKTDNLGLDYSFLNHSEDIGNTHKIDLKFYISNEINIGPDNIKIFSGDKKAYIKLKCRNLYRKPDLYRFYIESEKGETIVKEFKNQSEDINFLIENLQNGVKYSVYIYEIYEGKRKKELDKIEIKPYSMKENIKIFYKKAQLMYSNKKYKEAIDILQNAEKEDPGNADIIILKEKLYKIIEIEGVK